MKEFNFTLVYKIPKNNLTINDLIDSLEPKGCSDVFPGMDDTSKLSLSFNVKASSFSQAMNEARNGVSEVLVGAKLEDVLVQED